MGEETAKGFRADFASTDVLVPVYAATKRNLGVVGVENRDALKANYAVNEFERGGKAGFAFDVVARGKQMRGIETHADLQALQRVQHLAELFQARAERGAHAGGVFEQNAQRRGRQILGCLLDRFYGEPHGLAGFALAAGAGMNDHKLRAERDTSNEFVVKGLDGASAQHGLLRGEIAQIIGMNDQRAEAEFLAARAEGCSVGLRNAQRTAYPHARTGRKNLQGVATELVRGFARVGISTGNGSVDADTQAAVH